MIKECGLEAHEDMILSKQDFEYLFVKKGASKVCRDIGVDPIAFVDISEYLFSEAGPQGLTFRQFIDVVLQMRGSNHATVKDVVDLRRIIVSKLDQIMEV